MRRVVITSFVGFLMLGHLGAVGAAPAAERCACRQARPLVAGPWAVDLSGGVMGFGGATAQGVLDLFVTRVVLTYLKLGAGVATRFAGGLSGLFPEAVVGLRFPFGARVSLDIDWRVGYGAYHIESGVVLPLWRDAAVLNPSIAARFALTARLELWVAPFAVTTMISGHTGYVATWLEPHAGVGVRF